MVLSVNTNTGALTALRTLNKTEQVNAKNRTEISTGKRVNGPEDNAATFAIAQRLISEQSGRSAVTSSLNRAQSTSDVALAAGDQVSDLLLRARELSVQARDPGLDDTSRRALNQEFQGIRDQIGGIVESAEFNGSNLLKAGGGDASAITNEDGSAQFSIANQGLSLGGSRLTLAADADISTLSGANAAFGQIEQSSANVLESLGTIGSGANRFQELQEFNQILSDTTEVGIGNLVDANLAESSADFFAGQVREQLGIQSLAIANRQPQAILGLFDG